MNNNTFVINSALRFSLIPLIATTAISFTLFDRAMAGTLYDAINLGTIADNNYNLSGNRINNLGQIVGRAQVFSGTPLTSTSTTFLWQNGIFTNLSLTGLKVGGPNDGQTITMPGRGGLATNLNDLGTIVGTGDELPGPTDRGMFWSLNTSGNYELTIYEFGGVESYFYGINESNQIAGRHIYAPGKINAIYWENGIRTDLPSLGGDSNEARSINDLGQLVGWVDTDGADNSTNTFAATYWEKEPNGNWVLTNLGTWGGTQSFARSINNNGNIVGQIVTGTDPLTLNSNPYIYTNGVKTDLGSLGGTRGDALEVNSVGQVVGNSYIDASNTIQHAYLWEDGQLIDLNTIARNLNGWTLTTAVSINDRGDILARGTNPNFTYINANGQVTLQTRSFILKSTPEGKTTLSLTSLILVGAFSFKKRIKVVLKQ
jgi:probable HAF family extracellular repeat protein